MFLLKDIISSGKDKRLYAKKGSKVTVIQDCGNALIVEDVKGNKFSIHKNDVQI